MHVRALANHGRPPERSSGSGLAKSPRRTARHRKWSRGGLAKRFRAERTEAANGPYPKRRLPRHDDDDGDGSGHHTNPVVDLTRDLTLPGPCNPTGTGLRTTHNCCCPGIRGLKFNTVGTGRERPFRARTSLQVCVGRARWCAALWYL